MTTSKKVVEYHVARLKDKNPQVRLASIAELRKLNATDSLEALKTLFEEETDQEVKKAAQDAGREIFLATRKKE